MRFVGRRLGFYLGVRPLGFDVISSTLHITHVVHPIFFYLSADILSVDSIVQ